MKNTPLLRSAAITFAFVVMASVILGTFGYYISSAFFVSERSLTGRILHIFIPLLMFSLYLPVLLWLLLKRNTYAGKKQLFLRPFLLLALLNPITLLWTYSLITHAADAATGSIVVLIGIFISAIAVLLGLWQDFFPRKNY